MLRRTYITRAAGVIVVFFAGMSLAILPGSRFDVRAQNSQSFTASADTYVYSDKPTSNYASSPKLRVDASPVTQSYLRFDVQGVTGTVTKATLSIFTVSASSIGFDVRPVADTLWQESGITFAAAPPMGAAVTGSSGLFATGAWTQVDVTSAVTGSGSYSFGLTTTSTANMSLASRETTTPPQLVVETGGSTTTTGSASTTSTTTKPPPPPTTTTTTSPPATTTAPQTTTTPPSGGSQPTFPIRAAFYYPWFPEAWNQQGLNPFTHYHPSLGFYDASAAVVQSQIGQMQKGGLAAGIASWWGQGSRTDSRIGQLLSVANSMGTGFKWALYYEPEGSSDPTSAQVRSDLTYIDQHYASDPAYLKVNGKPVIFVYNANDLTCSIVDKWNSANTDFYVDLKVFSGYKTCANQPGSWHQYAPAAAEDHQAGFSFAISPGFYKGNEASPRLARDTARWATNARNMVASAEPWQLVTTFNEWGEGTSVESATEWPSSSGAGTYLDAVRTAVGTGSPPSSPPPPTTTTTTPTPPTTITTTAPVTPPPSGSDPVVAAAGDIACDPTSSLFNTGLGTSSACRQKWVSDLLLSMAPKAVLTLGDNQYESNTYAQFLASFDPSWGRVKSLIHPGIGNHEYLTSGAAGYFQYFGSAAGDPSKGYYSYDVGSWHLLALNSECSHIGGCSAGSPQETWVKQDLASHPSQCVLAYWHEPRFSSGQHGDAQQMATIWNDLVAGHADVVMSGHNHDYERFEPIGSTPAGTGSPSFQNPVLDSNGIREFVVGTGGKNHYGFGTQGPLTGEVVRDASSYGVLKLTLHPAGYDWQFVNDPGSGSFTDSGSGSCH